MNSLYFKNMVKCPRYGNGEYWELTDDGLDAVEELENKSLTPREEKTLQQAEENEKLSNYQNHIIDVVTSKGTQEFVVHSGIGKSEILINKAHALMWWKTLNPAKQNEFAADYCSQDAISVQHEWDKIIEIWKKEINHEDNSKEK